MRGHLGGALTLALALTALVGCSQESEGRGTGQQKTGQDESLSVEEFCAAWDSASEGMQSSDVEESLAARHKAIDAGIPDDVSDEVRKSYEIYRAAFAGIETEADIEQAEEPDEEAVAPFLTYLLQECAPDMS